MGPNPKVSRERQRARVILLVSVAVAAALALMGLARLLGAPRRNLSAAPARVLDFERFASAELPLNRGRALVLFLSPTCSHCLETARWVGAFDAEAHGLRVYFAILGKPEEVEPFCQTIEAWLPYFLVTPRDYADFAGDDPPTIYLLHHGRVSAQWPGSRFNLEVLGDQLRREP
jgi:hypothetical protein